jgi:Uma2 family endonuclease
MTVSLQTFKLETSVQCADHPIIVEEFLEMFGEDDLAELIDGTVVFKMAARYDHEALTTLLLSLLKVYVERHDLGIVLGSRSLVQIDPYTGLIPDVLFIRSDRQDIIRETKIVGPPDLVVEIASPSESVPDLIRKQVKYERRGVRELWMIDRRRGEVKAFRLGKEGRYELMPIEGGVLRSEVVRGFWLKIEWVLSEPEEMPKILDALNQIEGGKEEER